MSDFARRLLFWIGAALDLLGLGFVYAGWYGLSFPIACPNVPNGCGSYAPYLNDIFLGIILLLVGTTLMIGSMVLGWRWPDRLSAKS